MTSTSATAPCATHTVAQIGHNGGPPISARQWYKLIGPRIKQAIAPFQCGAPWTRFATEVDLRWLALMQVRIDRKQRALSEMKAARRRVMVKCVRRMRRDRGAQ